MDKIYTSKDIAQERDAKSYREFLKVTATEYTDSAVYARVDFGRWIADCECGGASYVDPKEDFFFCTACGNLSSNGKIRHVIFPQNYKDIETELLRRVVTVPKGMTGTQAAIRAVGKISRSWSPPETLEQLRAQRIQAQGE